MGILIVDDSADVRLLLEFFLKKGGNGDIVLAGSAAGSLPIGWGKTYFYNFRRIKYDRR